MTIFHMYFGIEMGLKITLTELLILSNVILPPPTA